MYLKSIVLTAMVTVAGCAGSPLQLVSMTPEELRSQNVFDLCNAYNFDADNEIRIELERRGALTQDEWSLVDQETIQAGMSELALICLRGGPVPGFGTVNVSTGSWGVHKQYVYEDAFGGRFYVYVENGKVTSWQR